MVERREMADDGDNSTASSQRDIDAVVRKQSLQKTIIYLDVLYLSIGYVSGLLSYQLIARIDNNASIDTYIRCEW